MVKRFPQQIWLTHPFTGQRFRHNAGGAPGWPMQEQRAKALGLPPAEYLAYLTILQQRLLSVIGSQRFTLALLQRYHEMTNVDMLKMHYGSAPVEQVRTRERFNLVHWIERQDVAQGIIRAGPGQFTLLYVSMNGAGWDDFMARHGLLNSGSWYEFLTRWYRPGGPGDAVIAMKAGLQGTDAYLQLSLNDQYMIREGAFQRLLKEFVPLARMLEARNAWRRGRPPGSKNKNAPPGGAKKPSSDAKDTELPVEAEDQSES